MNTVKHLDKDWEGELFLFFTRSGNNFNMAAADSTSKIRALVHIELSLLSRTLNMWLLTDNTVWLVVLISFPRGIISNWKRNTGS